MGRDIAIAAVAALAGYVGGRYSNNDQSNDTDISVRDIVEKSPSSIIDITADPDLHLAQSDSLFDILMWRVSNELGDIIDAMIDVWNYDREQSIDSIIELLGSPDSQRLTADQKHQLQVYRSDIIGIFSTARYIDAYLEYQINDMLDQFAIDYKLSPDEFENFDWQASSAQTHNKMRDLTRLKSMNIITGLDDYPYEFVNDIRDAIKDFQDKDTIIVAKNNNQLDQIAQFTEDGSIVVDGYDNLPIGGVGEVAFDRTTYNTEVSSDRDSLAAFIREHNVPGSFYGWPGLEVRTPSMSVSREFLTTFVSMDQIPNGTVHVSLGQYGVVDVSDVLEKNIKIAITGAVDLYLVLSDRQVRLLAPVGRLQFDNDRPVRVYDISIQDGISMTLQQYSETIGEKKKWYKRLFSGGSCRQYRNRYRFQSSNYSTTAIAIKAVSTNVSFAVLRES